MAGVFDPRIFDPKVFQEEEPTASNMADGGGLPERFFDVPVLVIKPVQGHGYGTQRRPSSWGTGSVRDAEITELWLLGVLTDDEWLAEMAA